jgi:hypothetical protein
MAEWLPGMGALFSKFSEAAQSSEAASRVKSIYSRTPPGARDVLQ